MKKYHKIFFFFKTSIYKQHNTASHSFMWLLAKRVLIKDFEHFTDIREFEMNNKIGDLFMTNLAADEWKKMREDAYFHIFENFIDDGVKASSYGL